MAALFCTQVSFSGIPLSIHSFPSLSFSVHTHLPSFDSGTTSYKSPFPTPMLLCFFFFFSPMDLEAFCFILYLLHIGLIFLTWFENTFKVRTNVLFYHINCHTCSYLQFQVFYLVCRKPSQICHQLLNSV